MNDNLHPIFQQALRGLFPPPVRSMPERLPMRAFMVQVIDRKSGTVRESFEAMAPDSVTCVQQHMSHALEGEKLDVMSLEAFREQQAKPMFTEAELLQADRDRQQRKDDLSRGCDERQMRRESELFWRGRDVEDFIRGGQ